MVRLSLLTLTSSLALVLALPQPQNACTTVCRPVKPECPEGQDAGGSEVRPTNSKYVGPTEQITGYTRAAGAAVSLLHPEQTFAQQFAGPRSLNVRKARKLAASRAAGVAVSLLKLMSVLLFAFLRNRNVLLARLRPGLRVVGDVVSQLPRSLLKTMKSAHSSVAPRNPSVPPARPQPAPRAAGVAANLWRATFVSLSAFPKSRNVLKARRQLAQRAAGDVARLSREKLVTRMQV
ncbi:hypothetical protein BJX66DRAFT_336194 [Aspergillus keveii]|uniref:Uncharacterized protein n=1 Tax=Aspergillus keveii TaxID=714993 RepID=A0ABR4GAZ6_9EURO